MTALQRYDYLIRIRFARRSATDLPDDDAITTEIADLYRAGVSANDAVSYFDATRRLKEVREA